MYFIIYVLLINCFTFFLFGLDKHRAQKHQWRIPERTLFVATIAGGSIGAEMGMLYFRHKTKHTQFKFGIPFILVMHVLILVFTR